MTGPDGAVPFVVLANQRTGSTWLVDLLDSHPEVACYSELFLEGASGTPKWGGRKDVEFFASSNLPVQAYLARLVAIPRVAAVGVKLMYGQAGAHPEVLPWLAARRGTVVHLRRRNVLARLIGAAVAVQRDLFHTRGQAPPPPPVVIDPGHLRSEISATHARWQRWSATLGGLGVAVVDVTYEALREHPQQTMNPVLQALGLPPPSVTSGSELGSELQRVITLDIESMLANASEVRDELERSGNIWMLSGTGPA